MRSVWRMTVGAHQIFLLLVLLLQTLEDGVRHLIAAEVRNHAQIDFASELAENIVAQGAQVPGIGVLLIGAAHVDVLLDDAAHHIHDALLLIHAFEQLAAHSVDGLALLVVDVVVFQEVFARLEILHFDRFLGLGDALGDEPGLDGHILFHAQAQHEVLHALAAEDAQQVILQREEEARTAGIALAAGAPAQLVIDAAGFVALGGHDVQPAQRRHLVVLLVGLRFEACVDLVPLVAAHAVELVEMGEVVEVLVGDVLDVLRREALGHLVLQAGVLGHELGVAAQQNVGAAAGHVGGNRHRALASGLRHNLGFALVILGVQDLMPDAHALQNAPRAFRISQPRWCPPAPAGPCALNSLISLAALRNFSTSVR